FLGEVGTESKPSEKIVSRILVGFDASIGKIKPKSSCQIKFIDPLVEACGQEWVDDCVYAFLFSLEDIEKWADSIYREL
ncbi:hypothetical protein LCGC14_2163420, partial [marine sediment metagenome]